MAGQLTKDQALQNLRQLCAEKKEPIGQIVSLMSEINPGASNDMGICCPLSGGPCFQATQAQCYSAKGTWHPKYTELDEPHQRLADLFSSNQVETRQMIEYLEQLNTPGQKEPLGI